MDASAGSPIIRVGLAAAANHADFDARLATVDRFIAQAGERDVRFLCFPEAYLPGLRGMDFEVPSQNQDRQERALDHVRSSASRHGVAVIIGMEWRTALGLHNLAFVIGSDGELLGHQAKNQIPHVEAPYYVPDGERRVFEADGVIFGVAICHEGWRYPETVRWSACHGAQIVFHPQLTGSDLSGPTIEGWGDPDAPYYEKAMIGRAVENEIWFASVNNAFRYQESATSLIAPDGTCVAHARYGEETLLVHDIDLALATRIYAQRFEPAYYPYPQGH